MSDTPEGDGWWQASDGKWYPPEVAPARSEETAEVAPEEKDTGAPPPWYSRWWVLLIAAAVLLGGGFGLGVLVAQEDDEEGLETAATATAEATEEQAPEQTETATEPTEEPTEQPTEETTPTEEPTSTSDSAVSPAPTLASPYLQGTLDLDLFPSEQDQASPAGEVAVIEVGTPQGTTPVIVRNNTGQPVEVGLTATARDANGDLVGSGEDQGLEPVWVDPGHIAIGYIYLGFEDPPSGTTIEVTAHGDEIDREFGQLPAVIVEHNMAAGQYSEQVVGIVRNEHEMTMQGPIGILVICTDDVGNPLYTAGGYLDTDSLEPGEEGSFSVDLYGDEGCPRYLVGASGYSF